MRYKAALHPDTAKPLQNRAFGCKWRFWGNENKAEITAAVG